MWLRDWLCDWPGTRDILSGTNRGWPSDETAAWSGQAGSDHRPVHDRNGFKGWKQTFFLIWTTFLKYFVFELCDFFFFFLYCSEANVKSGTVSQRHVLSCWENSAFAHKLISYRCTLRLFNSNTNYWYFSTLHARFLAEAEWQSAFHITKIQIKNHIYHQKIQINALMCSI